MKEMSWLCRKLGNEDKYIQGFCGNTCRKEVTLSPKASSSSSPVIPYWTQGVNKTSPSGSISGRPRHLAPSLPFF